MTVIAVCNQKGGPGKTTLAINLDRAFATDGMGVLLLDMDPQGSALDWGSTPSGRAFTAHLLKPPHHHDGRTVPRPAPKGVSNPIDVTLVRK